MRENQVLSLGWEDPLEKEMATHSVLLLGKSHGRRSLVGYSPRGSKESDTTEQLHFTSLLLTYTFLSASRRSSRYSQAEFMRRLRWELYSYLPSCSTSFSLFVSMLRGGQRNGEAGTIRWWTLSHHLSPVLKQVSSSIAVKAVLKPRFRTHEAMNAQTNRQDLLDKRIVSVLVMSLWCIRASYMVNNLIP